MVVVAIEFTANLPEFTSGCVYLKRNFSSETEHLLLRQSWQRKVVQTVQ